MVHLLTQEDRLFPNVNCFRKWTYNAENLCQWPEWKVCQCQIFVPVVQKRVSVRIHAHMCVIKFGHHTKKPSSSSMDKWHSAVKPASNRTLVTAMTQKAIQNLMVWPVRIFETWLHQVLWWSGVSKWLQHCIKANHINNLDLYSWQKLQKHNSISSVKGLVKDNQSPEACQKECSSPATFSGTRVANKIEPEVVN